MIRLTGLLLLAVLTLGGCADASGDTAPPSPETSPSPSAVTPSAPPPTGPIATEPGVGGEHQRITGVLGGDPGLEGGCVWLETGRGRIEPLWPPGYTSTADPVELLDAEGRTLARAGDRVTVAGRPAADMATICQVGEVWEITEVTVPGEG